MPLRLETERLVLTPEEESDAGWLSELFTARGGQRCTVDEARDRIATMQAMTAEVGIGVLVLRTHEGRPLGYCGLVPDRASVEAPELAYELLPAAHGQGYATEAAGAVLEAAFATGRQRIWATVRPWNTPSLRVLEKLDFRRDRTSEDAAGEILWLLRDHPARRPAGDRPHGRRSGG
jgi:RimJ/RimL family protein N-acetyltransferase